MSKETPTAPLTPEQEYKQLFNQLSAQYKTPLRNILGEAEEAVQGTISNLIQQLIQMNNTQKGANQRIADLQKLCTDNNVSFIPKSPNRKERRIKERKQVKDKKNQ